MEEFTEGRYLCYGDRIIFEITELEGCDLGGVLGVQELKYSNDFLNLPGTSSSKYYNNNKKVTIAQQFSENSNDVTRKRNFGFASISEKNGVYQPPTGFFLNNVFGIVAGVGFEAEGEPVYYGSQIKLTLSSTQEYLFAGNDQIDLMRKEDYDKFHLKECNFKIKPRHGVRLDGDRVFYNDLIVLVDYKGRELLPLSKNRIVLRPNVHHNHGLRIGLYLSAGSILPEAVHGGDVLQLYHKVECSYLVASPLLEDPSKVDIASHQVPDKKFLENSVSLWQVETIPYGEKRLKLSGPVFQGTPIRLRHIMSDKLLKYSDGHFSMVDTPFEYNASAALTGGNTTEDPTMFEFRVNIDALHEEDTVGVSGLRITFDSMVRLYHPASNSYLILRKDAKSSSKKFLASSVNFDRDVFQLLPISSKLLEIVLTAKRLKKGMSLVYEKLNLPNQPKFERVTLLQLASRFFALCVGEHSFLAREERASTPSNGMAPAAADGHESHGLNFDIQSVSHLIANEFGFVEILLQIANKAFQSVTSGYNAHHTSNNNNLKLSESEELLAKSAYIGLASLLKMDSSSIYPLLKSGGVPQMIQHFLIVHPNLSWNPPLLEYADAVNKECMKTNSTILVFNEDEIKSLLDKVYNQLSEGFTPTTFVYRLLAKACFGNANLLTNRLNGMNINKRMQMMIAEQLFGSPHETIVPSPQWSMMFYRTVLEEKKEFPRNKRNNHNNNSDSSVRPSTSTTGNGNNQPSENNPPSSDSTDDHQQHQEPKLRKKPYNRRFNLKITTSLVGQIRPHYTDASNMPKITRPIFPPVPKPSSTEGGEEGNNPANSQHNESNQNIADLFESPDYSDAEIYEAIQIRNQYFSAHETWKNSQDVEMKLQSLGYSNDSKVSIIIKQICKSTDWYTITDLRNEQLQFFAVSIQLLSALCIGRNLWCQRIIRHLLPVDHLLFFMDTMKNHSSLTNPYEISSPEMAHLILSVKTMMVSLLHTCYIDSAFSPSYEINPQETMFMMTSIYQMKNKKFYDVFHEECSLKVFALFSQIDKNDLLELSLEMSKEDITTCINHLPLDNATFYSFLKLMKFQCVENDQEIHEGNFDKKLFLDEILSIINIRDNLKTIQLQSNGSIGRGQYPLLKKIKEFKDKLIKLRKFLKVYYAEKAIHCVEQRTLLKKILLDFIHNESFPIWLNSVQLPLAKLMESKDHPAFESPQNTINNSTPTSSSGGGGAGAGAGGSTKLGSSKEVSIMNLNDYDDMEEEIREIRKHIHYLESMFALMKSLMLRGFFNIEYNVNPIYFNESGEEKLFYSKYDERSFLCYPALTYDERQILVMKCVVDPKAKKMNGRYNRDKEKRSLRLSLPFFQSKENNQEKEKEKKKKSSVSPHQSDDDDEDDDEEDNDEENDLPTSPELGGDLKILREIIENILKILSVRPGKDLPLAMCNINEDEKNIDEYYNRQYGYILDRYHLMKGVMETKLTCCKVLSTIIDVMQVTTEKELEKIFNILFDRMLEKKESQPTQSQGMNGGPSSSSPQRNNSAAASTAVGNMVDRSDSELFTNNLKRFQSFMQKSVSLFKHEDLKEFTKQLKLLLKSSLSRNYDLIWHVRELFREETFHILLSQIYDNNPFLRAEILNLIYRINARRSELNEVLLREIKLTKEIYNPTTLFLNRQRMHLLDILSHFDQCFDLTIPSYQRVRGNNHNKKDKEKEKEMVSPHRILAVMKKIKFYTLKLKKLLLNNDEHSGELGLINYCYYDLDTEEMLLIRRSALEFSANSPMLNTFGSMTAGSDSPNLSRQPTRKKLTTSSFAARIEQARQEEKANESSPAANNPLKKVLFKNLGKGNNNSNNEEKDNNNNNNDEEGDDGGEEIETPKISVNSTIEDILLLPINEDHQRDMFPFNFHKIVIDFIVANQVSFNAESSMYQYYLSTLSDENSTIELNIDHFPSLSVISHLLMFIRAYINGSVKNLRSILSKKFITALFEMRYCVKESLDLIIELLKKPSTQHIVLEFIEDRNFHALLNDIKFIVQFPEKFIGNTPNASSNNLNNSTNNLVGSSQQRRNIFGACQIEKLSELLQYLLISSNAKSSSPSASNSSSSSSSHSSGRKGNGESSNTSSSFMNFFLAMLNEMITYYNRDEDYFTNQLAFQRLLSIGVDIESQANEHQTALTAAIAQAAGIRGVTSHSESSSSSSPAAALGSSSSSSLATSTAITFPTTQFTRLDIKRTCHRYQKETNRITFSRLSKDILADPLLNESIYIKLRKALELWKLLPTQSIFQLHLDLVELIANSALHSITLQDVYRQAFLNNYHFIFELLFIDKLEIRFAYLQFLNGIWFSRQIEEKIVVPTEFIMAKKIQMNMKALLKLCIQDIKLFLFIIQDVDINYYGEFPSNNNNNNNNNNNSNNSNNNSASNTNTPVKNNSSNNQVSTPNSKLFLSPGRSNLLQHVQLLEKYLIQAVIPFLLNFFKSNFYEFMISSSNSSHLEDNSEGEEDNLPKKSKKPENNTAPSTISSGPSLLSPIDTKQQQQPAAPPFNSNHFPSLVNELSESLADIVQTVGGNFLSLVDVKGLATMFKTLREESRSTTTLMPSTSSMSTRQLNSTQKCIRFLMNREKYIRTFGSANANTSSVGRHLKDFTSEDEILFIKRKCLNEFIPEVDQFALTYGYGTLDHLVRTPNNTFYLFDREYARFSKDDVPKMHHVDTQQENESSNSGGGGSRKQKHGSHLEIDDTKYQLVSNPLNCETFRFTEREISKFIVGHCYYKYSDRFLRILKLMDQIPNNQEDEFKFFWDTKYQELEDLFRDKETNPNLTNKDFPPSNANDDNNNGGGGLFSSFFAKKDSGSVTSPYVQGSNVTVNPRLFSEYCFARWNKYGGLLIAMIFEHLQYSILCYKGEKSLYSSSIDLNDLTKCNSYWINTFTKGLLKSKINYLFDEYAEQTEIQLLQLEVEGLRLSLIQDILCDIGATNLIVRQLSLPESMLHRIVSPTTIESIYSMAIDFGAGLNQNGNMATQNLFIDTIEQERILAIRAGYENHSFIYIIRGLLQRYSILFQTRDGLTTEAASKCVALLRFLQLLCERHNSKAQNYFGENKIVIEVAGFVNDLSLILSQEMNEIFLTDEELLTRDQPIILGFRRPVIRWINPLPDSFRVTNSSMKNVPKLRPQSNSNHVGANGNRIHPVEESPTKLEMIHGSNSLNDDFLDGDDPMTPVSRKFNPPPPTATNNNNNTNAADGSTNPAGTSGGGNGNSPKKSSSSSTKKAQATTKFLDLSRLQLLCEVMNAGLQTLTEFNQGPRPEIQLMMARTGVTSEFNTFFKFFGAFHLFTKVDFETKTNLQKKQFHSLYQKKVKARITCETLLSLDMKDTPSLASSMPSTHHFTSGNSSDVYWIGNDPLANFLILSSISEDRHGKKHKKSNNNKDSPEEYLAWATQDAIDGIQQYTEESFSSIGNLCYKMMTCHCNYVFNYFITEITGGDGDILDLEKEFSKFNLQRQRKALVLEDIQDWAYEKHLYLEYRKKKSKMAKIMQRNIYEDIDQFENILIHFEESCIKFLSSLIEGISIVDKDNIEIPTIIFNDIEKENIVCNMSNFWNRYLHYNSIIPEDNGKENESYEWNLAYNYLVLVSQFLDLGVKEITTDLDELFAKWQDESEIILDDYIGRIEVRSPVDSKSLVVTYFPIPQLIKTYWNRSEIEEFRDHILYPTVKGTRDSIDEKVKNFLRDGRKLILTLRHLESLDEIIAPQSFIYRFFINIAHNFKRWNMLCFIFTLALNMLLILSVKLHQRDVNDVNHTVTNINMSGTGENMTQYYIHGKLYERILFILGWCQLLSTTLTVYSFMIMFGWLYIKMGLKENENNQFEFHGFYITKLVKFAYDFYLLGRRGSLNFQKNHLTLETWTVTAIFVHLFSHGDSIYFMALFFFSLLGNLRNPLFYALCLMEVLRSSKLMLYVSRAFTVNIGQVIATVALAAILLYLFTTYAFSSSQIRNHYELNGMGADGCYSLQECFRMHLDYGLLQSVFWDYPSEIQTAEGEIYNFLFTFIMQIVIPGLISGIIIDTFSQMRQDKQDIEDDVCNTCFICNIDREDFESMNISFEDHIRHDHNLWKYLWFNIYLFEKDITEFDGIESYCHAIIGFGDFTTRWLPIKMARSLSTIRDKYDLFTIYNKITTLQVMIDKFTVNMKGDLYRTEKHVREAIKDEMSQIEKDTKEILGKLEKKVKGGGGGGGGHHGGSALRAGKKSSK